MIVFKWYELGKFAFNIIFFAVTVRGLTVVVVPCMKYVKYL